MSNLCIVTIVLATKEVRTTQPIEKKLPQIHHVELNRINLSFKIL